MKAIEEAVRSDAPATRVVVVEDDQASADVLQRRLQANGMVVSVAHDGKRGIELVEELLPDLVLLDVMLPDTDGYDVCLRIKSNTATSPIPVIFLSARGEVVDKVRGLSCGAADYITKPFQAAELLARIDAVLGQARNPRTPRLGRPIERAPGERLVARVAIADAALREHVEQLLPRSASTSSSFFFHGSISRTRPTRPTSFWSKGTPPSRRTCLRMWRSSA